MSLIDTLKQMQLRDGRTDKVICWGLICFLAACNKCPYLRFGWVSYHAYSFKSACQCLYHLLIKTGGGNLIFENESRSISFEVTVSFAAPVECNAKC